MAQENFKGPYQKMKFPKADPSKQYPKRLYLADGSQVRVMNELEEARLRADKGVRTSSAAPVQAPQRNVFAEENSALKSQLNEALQAIHALNARVTAMGNAAPGGGATLPGNGLSQGKPIVAPGNTSGKPMEEELRPGDPPHPHIKQVDATQSGDGEPLTAQGNATQGNAPAGGTSNAPDAGGAGATQTPAKDAGNPDLTAPNAATTSENTKDGKTLGGGEPTKQPAQSPGAAIAAILGKKS